MSTLVLDLDDKLVSRLSEAAARNHKPMREWVTMQLARLVDSPTANPAGAYSAEWQATFGSIADASFEAPARERMREALGSLSGIWKDRGTTDELMNLTRGED